VTVLFTDQKQTQYEQTDAERIFAWKSPDLLLSERYDRRICSRRNLEKAPAFIIILTRQVWHQSRSDAASLGSGGDAPVAKLLKANHLV
jgi:hypothetical protein